MGNFRGQLGRMFRFVLGGRTAKLQKQLNRLQEREQSLRIMLLSMGDGVIATDSRATITMLNPSAEELTGWPLDRAVGRPFSEVFHVYNSVTGQPIEDIVQTVLTTGNKVDLTNHTVLISAAGIHRHISHSAAPIRDGQGQLAGVVLIFSDITERYHLQQQLRLSEARSTAAVKLARLGTWEYDAVANTVVWSPVYKQIMGVPADFQPEPESWDTLVHPDDLGRAVAVRLEAMECGTSYTQQYRIHRHNDDALRYLQTHVSIERDDGGNVVKMMGALQDVTDQVEAQQRVLESEALFRMTFERTAVGMAHVALDGRLMRANPALCSILGYQEPELLERTLFDIAQSDSWESMRRNMDCLLARRVPSLSAERRFLHKNGEVVWLALTTTVIAHRDGSPAYLIMSAADITERRQAEAALRESEQRLRRAQEISHSGNWEISLADSMMWASDEAFCIYGYEIGEGNFIPLAVPQGAVVEEDRPRMDRALHQLLTNDTPYDVEFTIRRFCDGERRNLRSAAIAERDDQGRPLRVVGVLQDITERKRTEQEYKKVLETTMDGFWMVDGQMRILMVNTAVCDLLGYTRGELLGMQVPDLEMQYMPQEVSQLQERIRQTGSERFETRLRRKDGVTIDVEVSLSYTADSRYTCAFIRDITDRRRKENRIQFLSYHDAMTGLYNRVFFEEECRRLDTASQLPVSIIMGDINGLKLTNDVLGHAHGDELLRTIAAILRRCARDGDIIARVGGDEFCLLLPNAEPEVARAMCKRIRHACEETVLRLGDSVFRPSLALGYATRQFPEQSFAAVFKDTEDAMYRRKLLERKSMHSSLIASIRTTMYEKSHETREHADRMASLARRLGEAMGLNDDQLSELELLSSLHDLGKIGIAEHILDKPGPLSREEWLEMRKHPEIGYRIAQASPELAAVAEGILCHHERWDGTGYPQGLRGDAIPLLARILTIVDSYDAMTNDRAYHKAVSESEALGEIVACAGRQFDPSICEKFLFIMQGGSPASQP